jgi:hypothetical protein
VPFSVAINSKHEVQTPAKAVNFLTFAQKHTMTLHPGPILARINSPHELRKLKRADLLQLAGELRGIHVETRFVMKLKSCLTCKKQKKVCFCQQLLLWSLNQLYTKFISFS